MTIHLQTDELWLRLTQKSRPSAIYLDVGLSTAQPNLQLLNQKSDRSFIRAIAFF
ncbi:MAG TPA: hypothetical protein V6D15_23825 [Oculatellaceae cyanobacterium]